MVVQRIERRIRSRQHFQIETLVKSARQELRRQQLFRDRIEVQIGGFFGEPLLEAEKFLESKVQPQARRCSAEQVIMTGENTPDASRILQCRSPNLQILERNSLAVEHAENVVVGLH